MQRDQYMAFCGGFAHATHVVQWGQADVWKIGGKMFAIGWSQGHELPLMTFKVSPMSFNLLKEQEGLIPAPYLASRGMKWIQRTSRAFMDDETLRVYLAESYRLVSLNLTKIEQKRLGLNQPK